MKIVGLLCLFLERKTMEMEQKRIEIQQLPLIALRGLVVFPGRMVHFDVGRKKSVQALNEAMDHYDQTVFLVAQTNLEDEEPSKNALHTMGVVARVRQILKLPGDTLRILVEGVCRARVVDIVQEEPFYEALVQSCPVLHLANHRREEAMVRQCRAAFEEYINYTAKPSADVFAGVNTVEDPGELADLIAYHMPLPLEDKQHLLEILPISRRVETLLSILSKEIEILKIEQKIRNKVQHQMDQNQRDYYLHEQMKAIADELGEEDPLEESDSYRQKIEALSASAEIKQKLREESDKLSKMPIGSHEATVVRGYLDLCLSLPWGKTTEDHYDLAVAKKVLDRDHYGMEKVKERMLELLAVRSLNPDIKGQIICLAGPPGVGKTSIARCVAEAMGRKYVRVSLGGVKDESDIRGHRKTYIGAMPGRIITAIKNAGTVNPLILLDEIDKMSNDFRGDPSSAMLEVLDPEQNTAFEDHFVEVSFDLSQVLFVTTANDIHNIPAPLLDRMEIIELSSYTAEEKFQIARRHLWKKQLGRHGLSGSQIRMSDTVLKRLIEGYTKEAGVRQLERELAKICRKVSVKIVSGEAKSVSVGRLEPFLGPQRYKPDVIETADEVGVVNGLAWTSVGGEMLPVEVAILNGTGKIELTGSLGDVMKESAHIAVSYVRSHAEELGVSWDFYKTKDIHIHAPEGAVPKDGPSAGVTMATALVSALTGNPAKQTIAMTGEISLRGRVLPIGGLREKAMAAYTHGIKTVFIPALNKADLADVDAVVKENVEFVPVERLDAVFSAALVRDPFLSKTAVKNEPVLPESVSTAMPIPSSKTSKTSVVHQ